MNLGGTLLGYNQMLLIPSLDLQLPIKQMQPYVMISYKIFFIRTPTLVSLHCVKI